MHKFAPEAADSRAHLSKIDSFLKEASEADPDVAFIIAPDHGMNSKSHVVNLNLALTRLGAPVKIAMSAERDQYPRHHGGYGGTAFIYLKDAKDTDKVMKALRGIEGVEDVLTRDEAAKKHRLNPHRIGDLWVTATKRVVFGHSKGEREELPKDYRSHGSAHEQDIPCFIHRYAGKLPDRDAFTTNADMAKFLFQKT
jgi:phosphonoacetate hydrolase